MFYSIVGIGGNKCNSMFGRPAAGCSQAGEVVILHIQKVCFDFQSFTLEFITSFSQMISSVLLLIYKNLPI